MLNRLLPLTPAERRIRREVHAAATRAQALALRRSGETYQAIGAALGDLSREHARQIVRKAERLTNDPRWHDGLPARAQTFLHLNGLADLPEPEAAAAVAQLSRCELMSHPNVGKGAVAALTAWLAAATVSEATGPCVEARKDEAAAGGGEHVIRERKRRCQ